MGSSFFKLLFNKLNKLLSTADLTHTTKYTRYNNMATGKIDLEKPQIVELSAKYVHTLSCTNVYALWPLRNKRWFFFLFLFFPFLSIPVLIMTDQFCIVCNYSWFQAFTTLLGWTSLCSVQPSNSAKVQGSSQAHRAFLTTIDFVLLII